MYVEMYVNEKRARIASLHRRCSFTMRKREGGVLARFIRNSTIQRPSLILISLARILAVEKRGVLFGLPSGLSLPTDSTKLGDPFRNFCLSSEEF